MTRHSTIDRLACLLVFPAVLAPARVAAEDDADSSEAN